MVFKINISEKSGKTFHIEAEAENLVGKELHDKIEGKDISEDLGGYEFEITGASDKSGFTALESVDGIGLKKVLLSYEKGMKKRPRKEGKKKLSNKTPGGLRLRKTVRGKVISEAIVQINLKVLKEGDKKLQEVFADQCQPKNKENRKAKRVAVAEEKKKAAEVEKTESPASEEAVKEGTNPEQEPTQTEAPKEGIEEAK